MVLSPPMAKTRPAAYVAPTLPAAFGMESSFVQVSFSGS